MPKIRYTYEPHDKSFLVNDGDPDLIPIRISLPSPPKLELIEGYGLPPEEQRFKRVEMPLKLQQLQRKIIDTLNKRANDNRQFIITYYNFSLEFWGTLDDNRDYYEKEIEFIKRMWWHRLNGYWFFNRGKPTFITGWHFMYLNFWHMPDVKGGYPEYRERDKDEFYFHHYAYTTTETFAKLDERGWAVPNEDGSYDMFDLGRRVCYGLGQPKNRRSGNTNKGLSNIMEICTRTIGTDGVGVMSYTGENAKKHYKGKVMPAWDEYPLFFRPYSLSKARPKSLIFNTPSNDFVNKGLGNSFTYAETSNAKFYDGTKLMGVLEDECGKTTEIDVDERGRVIANCLSLGNGLYIHGYKYAPSTVEDYTKGGEAFRKQMNQSSFYQRIGASGQTPSGLFRLFKSAEEGLEKKIDSYGYSVRGVIKDYQRAEGFTQTADEYLSGIKEHHLKQDTPESMAAYRSQKKLFPQRWADCWIGDSGEIGFDIEKIDNRMVEIRRMMANGQNPVVRGNFEWTNGFGSDVRWDPHEEKGRFEVSDLCLGRQNKKIKDLVWDFFDNVEKEAWKPYDPSFGTAGADPIKFKKQAEVKRSYSKSGTSDGGFNVLREYNPLIDGEKPRSEWDTENLVCTYRYRPKTDDEYCEDVLKACIWYGVMVYPEMNLAVVYKRFREWGYAGYLKHDIMDDGKMKEEPGTHLHTQSKQEGFSLLRNFIDYRCHKINHLSFLNECKEITNFDDLQNYDLLASVICSLLGSRSRHAKVLKSISEATIDISGLLKMHNY